MLNLQTSGKTFIVHPWHADGVCSAAVLSDYLAPSIVETCVPPIGTYHLSPEITELAETDSFLDEILDILGIELVTPD